MGIQDTDLAGIPRPGPAGGMFPEIVRTRHAALILEVVPPSLHLICRRIGWIFDDRERHGTSPTVDSARTENIWSAGGIPEHQDLYGSGFRLKQARRIRQRSHV